MHERSYRRQTVDEARTTFRQPTQNHALASVATVATYSAAGKSLCSKYRKPIQYKIAANNNGNKQFGIKPNESIDPSE